MDAIRETLAAKIRKLELALDYIVGQTTDLEQYGEEELRARLAHVRRLAVAAIDLTSKS